MFKKTLLLFSLSLLLLTAACTQPAQQAAIDEAAIAATVEARVLEALAEHTAAQPTEELAVAPVAGPQETPEVVGDAVPIEAPAEVDSLLDLERALVGVYDAANPAVVYIVVPGFSTGSGFVYSDEGHIVTNNHVVAGGESFEIVFAGGDRREATLVGADTDSDLAVLQVEDLPAGVEPLPLADLSDVRVGEIAVAIGNPFGEQGSMSLGIISALGRSLTSQRVLEGGSSYSLPAVIQTDAPINPGNSGGPLLNLDGEVIGVNSAIVSFTGTNSGVGYAIPVDAVRRIVPSLIENGSYVYPYMGASFDASVSLDELELYGVPQTQGTYVISVLPDSPAAEAGLRSADPVTGRGGDLIIAIDGEPVNEFGDMNRYLVFNTSPGQTVALTVLRDGETVTVSLTLGERP